MAFATAARSNAHIYFMCSPRCSGDFYNMCLFLVSRDSFILKYLIQLSAVCFYILKFCYDGDDTLFVDALILFHIFTIDLV